ncbi:unnamed protein product [Protopolystoma xenopodis]|uniref:Uncharacterized protein n=1 Tax=Protopolystoma xenopodis TaxID=117903 RepID=A0A448X5K5_9PLAT|nr:unnamed protein product [Protopolystoma xenopodis]
MSSAAPADGQQRRQRVEAVSRRRAIGHVGLAIGQHRAYAEGAGETVRFHTCQSVGCVCVDGDPLNIGKGEWPDRNKVVGKLGKTERLSFHRLDRGSQSRGRTQAAFPVGVAKTLRIPRTQTVGQTARSTQFGLWTNRSRDKAVDQSECSGLVCPPPIGWSQHPLPLASPPLFSRQYSPVWQGQTDWAGRINWPRLVQSA